SATKAWRRRWSCSWPRCRRGKAGDAHPTGRRDHDGHGARRERGAASEGAAVPPRPSPSQLVWQRDELALFLHFGVNTFTDHEWGDGREDPTVFNPTALDARQWARAGRAAGARALILTAKHHDGFCLWPSRLTTHPVARGR